MNRERRIFLEQGLSELPESVRDLLSLSGKNGESLATDEAAVWKRVLNYRIAKYLLPNTILETHAGIDISTAIYKPYCKKIISLKKWEIAQPMEADLIDIDPYGQPWDCICHFRETTRKSRVTMVSNGEALAVWRNLRKQQKYPTDFFGKRMPLWIIKEYLPRLEKATGLKIAFFYAFPSSIRVVLSREKLPERLFLGCHKWMWWLQKYAPKKMVQGRLW